MDDVVRNKVESIERCLSRIHEMYDGDHKKIVEDFNLQDVAVLNLMRACEQAIKLASHIVSKKGLGNPKTYKETFELLEDNKIIDSDLSKKLKAMTGFRNIATHAYQKLNEEILISILDKELNSFDEFNKLCLNLSA